jgi:F-type H+-transporting ATPase subunit gamma
MPSLIDIRRRIKSVKNTQQITKAMKMVAAARLRKAQDRVLNARPYSRLFSEMLASVSSAAGSASLADPSPLITVREEKVVQLVLLTADRGFAGGFNTNLIKAAQAFMSECPGRVQAELYGKKGRDFFRRRNLQVSGEMVGVSESPTWDIAHALGQALIQRFTAGEVDAVYLIYNEFKSVLSQKVMVQKLLPIAVPSATHGGPPVPTRDYIYEQPPAYLRDALLPRSIDIQVYQAFLESAAAEHAARMTAMDAATSNANEVIDKLTLYMNRVRQASITKEIIEVVSGAAALE